MATSKMLRAIAEGLKICGAGEEVMLAILCLLKTKEQEQAMLDYMLKMEKPEEPTKLLEKAVELTR